MRRRLSPPALALLALLTASALLAACLNGKPGAVPSPDVPTASVAPTSSATGAPSAGATDRPTDGSPPAPGASPSASQTAAKPQRMEARLLAVGDILVHMPLLPAYYDRKRDDYDFTPWFAQVKPLLAQGDWVVANLESPIAGKDLKYSGFPRFNAPTTVADALVDAGFQIVSTANNHTMDRGFQGIVRTFDNAVKAGLVPVGTARSAYEARSRVVIEERNGIRLGFAAYTYGTNGIPVPQDKAYAVNLIDPAKMREDIRKLRKAGADAVAVSLHFGVEYQRQPNAEQRRIAREAVAAGADIVLGSHPHVVQPYEEIAVPAAESADGTARRGIVIYSLGNFISNQSGDWKDVGLIFGVSLVKTVAPDGRTTVEWTKVSAIPTWVHIDRRKPQARKYTVIPMAQALADRKTPDLTDADYRRLRDLLEGMEAHLAGGVSAP